MSRTPGTAVEGQPVQVCLSAVARSLHRLGSVAGSRRGGIR